MLRGGLTAYQIPIKTSLLQVAPSVITGDGVVSPAVALAMARGACALFEADVAIATTGVAGPGPSDGVAAGTIVVAALSVGEGGERAVVRRWRLAGSRTRVRQTAARLAVVAAADLLSQAAHREQSSAAQRCPEG